MIESYVIGEVNKVLKDVSNALNADRSTFFLLHPKTNILVSLVAQRVEEITLKIPLNKGIIGRCVHNETPIIENNPESSPYFDNTYDKLLRYQTKSIICVPVEDIKGNVIGGLQSLNAFNGRFETDDVKLLSSFAGVISLLIQNSKLHFLDNKQKKAYATLLDVFGEVTAELDFEQLVPLIMEKAAEITSSERSTLYFLDEKTGSLKSKYAKGLKENGIKVKQGIAGFTFKTKKSLLVNDPYNHPEFDSSVDAQTGFKTNSILCAPIYRSKKDIIGVIQVINHKQGAYGVQEQKILEGFADQIRIALDNSILFNQINGMKNYLNVLIENMDNGIVTMDNQGNIQTFNKKFLSMFELDNEEIFKTGCNLIELDGEIHQLLKQCLYPINTQKKFIEYDLSYPLSKKRKLVFNLSALPMENNLGSMVGVIGIFQDVTKEKRIRSNLSRYIPQHLVNEIINKDNLSFMQSKIRKCTVLFSDIRNFTSLTETLGASQVVKMLNLYFDAMAESIHAHHGVLDKFIGDAVMGVFGLPYTNTQDPINAVRCALAMLDKLEQLNASGQMDVKLDIGIGISTGKVISGNIGSDKRYEYTVIGDSVNLASRLESETKSYKEHILICDETYKVVRNHFICKKIGEIQIKGKSSLETVYAVADD